MKTNQNLIRKMGDFNVIQRTQDGMFDATSLLSLWNKTSGQKKVIGHYFENSATQEFINALIEDELKHRKSDNSSLSSKNTNTRDSVYLKTRGIKGGTWMSPLLFIDFAMWLNPSFKVQVLRFVYDELIKYRNEAGDAYREMAGEIKKIVPAKELPVAISKVAKALNFIVYNQHESEIRNKQAEESKVKELAELEKDIAMLIKRGFIKSFDHLIGHLRTIWREKYEPVELAG